MEKSCILGLGFISQGIDGNTVLTDIKDGKIVRIRPLHYDWKYKPEEYKPWKMEARGTTFEAANKTSLPPHSLAYKKRVYSSSRILYPLKRIDFDPKGEKNFEKRGESEFVRISWDEALEIITGQLKRIITKYGPYAIFSQSDGHGENKVVHGPHGCHRKLLQLLGGFTQQIRNPDSWEGWYWGAKHVWGNEPVGLMKQSNVMPDVAKNSDMILFWGADPETTCWAWAGQTMSNYLFWLTQLGIKQIYICPDLNYTAAIHADKWIPIKPNTDICLQMAIAYLWITSDNYDKEYIKTHVIGFDKVRDYVLGKEDGLPKTAKWASEQTGIPTRIIKALAKEWGSKVTSIAHGNGGGMIRGAYSTEPARMEIVLLAMRGLGKPGVHQMKFAEQGLFGEQKDMSFPRAVFMPQAFAAYTGWMWEKEKQMIPKTMVHEAILNPPISWYGGKLMLFEDPEFQFIKTSYPAKGCSEIHMIWTDSPCFVTCWNDGNKFIEALKSSKIEFILAQHPWMENDMLFADLILPANTKFEEEDIGCDCNGYNYRMVNYEEQCIAPLGESFSDYEITCKIAKKLGLLEKYTGGRTIPELIKTGFEHSGAADYISYEKWKANGYWVVPTDTDWEKYPVGMSEFCKDPEAHPLTTPTGKLEFYSEKLAKHFPDDEERPPYPKWIPYGESHQESLLCERAKDYPFLMVSNHPRWGIHANHQDVTWFREIETGKVKGPDGYLYHPVWINPKDAEAKGIINGDVVEVFNERGIVLGGAYVTERMMQGSVSSDHGAKYDPIVAGKIDRGGAFNTICPHNNLSKNATGMVTCGFLVDIKRADLNELRRKYPEAFNRPFHPFAGTGVESFLYKGGK